MRALRKFLNPVLRVSFGSEIKRDLTPFILYHHSARQISDISSRVVCCFVCNRRRRRFHHLGIWLLLLLLRLTTSGLSCSVHGMEARLAMLVQVDAEDRERDHG